MGSLTQRRVWLLAALALNGCAAPPIAQTPTPAGLGQVTVNRVALGDSPARVEQLLGHPQRRTQQGEVLFYTGLGAVSEIQFRKDRAYLVKGTEASNAGKPLARVGDPLEKLPDPLDGTSLERRQCQWSYPLDSTQPHTHARIIFHGKVGASQMLDPKDVIDSIQLEELGFKTL